MAFLFFYGTQKIPSQHALKNSSETFVVSSETLVVSKFIDSVKNKKIQIILRKNVFACLFSVHNILTLSRHEKVVLIRKRPWFNEATFGEIILPSSTRFWEKNLSKCTLIKHTC